MAHGSTPGQAYIDKRTQDRLSRLQTTEKYGLQVVENFGIFIDTHRDQPHVGVFYDDIHRGMCRPTPVDYIVGDDRLINRENNEILQRHDKHMFVTEDYFAQFLLDYMMENGKDPRDGDGVMPTSHFRDARAKVYHLKSFRELVRLRDEQERTQAAGKRRPKRKP